MPSHPLFQGIGSRNSDVDVLLQEERELEERRGPQDADDAARRECRRRCDQDGGSDALRASLLCQRRRWRICALFQTRVVSRSVSSSESEDRVSIPKRSLPRSECADAHDEQLHDLRSRRKSGGDAGGSTLRCGCDCTVVTPKRDAFFVDAHEDRVPASRELARASEQQSDRQCECASSSGVVPQAADPLDAASIEGDFGRSSGAGTHLGQRVGDDDVAHRALAAQEAPHDEPLHDVGAASRARPVPHAAHVGVQPRRRRPLAREHDRALLLRSSDVRRARPQAVPGAVPGQRRALVVGSSVRAAVLGPLLIEPWRERRGEQHHGDEHPDVPALDAADLRHHPAASVGRRLDVHLQGRVLVGDRPPRRHRPLCAPERRVLRRRVLLLPASQGLPPFPIDDLFYSALISTWFSNVDNPNNFDDRIGPHALTRDVDEREKSFWTGRLSLMNVRCRYSKAANHEDVPSKEAVQGAAAAACAALRSPPRSGGSLEYLQLQRRLHPGVLRVRMVAKHERDRALRLGRARVLRDVPAARARAPRDLRAHQAAVHPTSCMGSTAYLISASLVLLALSVSDLTAFFCHLPIYIWGAFFIVWLYSLFNVVEELAVRRFVGPSGDFSKKMVISESVKILRLTVLLIIALIIYSSALGSSQTLKYSILAVIGLAIALGFVPSFHNVVGGLFLAFNSQFKIDDFIEVGDAKGFVHRVSLRYTTIVSMDGTKLYVPNSFFLYKPMVNFTQRPKQDIDIHVKVSTATSVDKMRLCITKLEVMLQSLHVALTSHEENQSDLRHGEKWERFFFVAMEELYQIRVYSYTEELDSRKYAMIKSEVWLAVMEIMEELGIDVLSQQQMDGNTHHNPFAESPHTRNNEIQSPFATEMNSVIGAQGSTPGGHRTQL